MDLLDFIVANRSEVLRLALEHLALVAIAVGAAVAVGLPVGILLTRRPALSRPVLAVANVLQTIPSLALFGFLIPLLGAYGIGRVPAVIALFLYSLLPIIRNTYTGITGVDPAVREAARGMGMTDGQVLRLVELPLALGVVVAGIRVAAVIAVGTATIAAAIGAGGLGMYIFRGLRMNDNTLILAGAVPAALMALAADGALGWLERSIAPGASRTRTLAARLSLATAALAVALGGVAWAVGLGAGGAGERAVVVGSKDFTEQVILGELVAQSLEQAGVPVERQFELGGDLCHRGLLEGTIDTYVEYSGTAYTSILKHDPVTDPRVVYEQVRREYADRFDLEWLPPLGFDNTFAILVRGDVARRLGLKTISDAARYAPEWRAGFGQDFMSREDGYPGFSRAYGLRFSEPPREMDLSLTYRALAGGQVDLIAGNSTDGLIDELDLVQLEDDRRYFPPYEAAAVVRAEVLDRYPAIRPALETLAGRITDADMRRLNYAVDGERRTPRDVVAAFLKDSQR
jgi:osmoprotectant transport system permease protein